ncbi:MAG: hypothetical protein HRU26_07110 [Psychroserpens sp.]|nr:hypothetical protein [Psychroserpens sp.]
MERVDYRPYLSKTRTKGLSLSDGQSKAKRRIRPLGSQQKERDAKKRKTKAKAKAFIHKKRSRCDDSQNAAEREQTYSKRFKQQTKSDSACAPLTATPRRARRAARSQGTDKRRKTQQRCPKYCCSLDDPPIESDPSLSEEDEQDCSVWNSARNISELIKGRNDV